MSNLREQFQDIIGLTIDEASERVRDRGINSIRPLMIDGEIMMGSMDMRKDRLNVSLSEGKITGISKIG